MNSFRGNESKQLKNHALSMPSISQIPLSVKYRFNPDLLQQGFVLPMRPRLP